jgi:uncharacterized protein
MKLIDQVNPKLNKYIKKRIFPLYKCNNEDHGINHIKLVIERSFEIAKEYMSQNDGVELNPNIIYVVAAYHDLGDCLNRKRHHVISAQIAYEDSILNEFFNPTEKKIIKEAIEDHRASGKNEPRSIYGRLVSTADKDVNVDEFLHRTISFSIAHNPGFNIEEIIEEVYQASKKRFGKDGYCRKKDCLPSKQLDMFFKEMTKIIEDKDQFCKKAKEIYYYIVSKETLNNNQFGEER